MGRGPRGCEPGSLPPPSRPSPQPGGIARSGMLLAVRTRSQPSLALRLFSVLQEVSPNSILCLKDPAKREAKGSDSPFEGDGTERGLRQPGRSRCAAPLPGGERRPGAGQERDRKGTGAGQERDTLPRDPHPLLPHLWPCLKFLHIPHHSGME